MQVSLRCSVSASGVWLLRVCAQPVGVLRMIFKGSASDMQRLEVPADELPAHVDRGGERYGHPSTTTTG
jgi:hypothetical protein